MQKNKCSCDAPIKMPSANALPSSVVVINVSRPSAVTLYFVRMMISLTFVVLGSRIQRAVRKCGINCEIFEKTGIDFARILARSE